MSHKGNGFTQRYPVVYLASLGASSTIFLASQIVRLQTACYLFAPQEHQDETGGSGKRKSNNTVLHGEIVLIQSPAATLPLLRACKQAQASSEWPCHQQIESFFWTVSVEKL